MRHNSIVKSTYFVAVFDSYSGYRSVQFIHRNTEADDAIQETVTALENLFNGETNQLTAVSRNSTKRLRAGGGGECSGETVQNWLKNCVIVHAATTVDFTESKVSAERLRRAPPAMARTMLGSFESPPNHL